MLDGAELSRLYDAHATSLFGYLLNLTRSEADTRDLLQSVFCRIAQRPELVSGVRDERAFLLRMAYNASVDWARRCKAHRRRNDAWASDSAELFAPASDPDAAGLRRELDEALAELGPDQRAVVHLKLWEGMTFDAIAETLEISVNTAASRYRYALDKLRARLRPLYDEIR